LLFVVAGFLFFLPLEYYNMYYYCLLSIIFCLLLLEHNRYILW